MSDSLVKARLMIAFVPSAARFLAPERVMAERLREEPKRYRSYSASVASASRYDGKAEYSAARESVA